jgi:methyl-accepting chemotaxis protein
VDAANAQEAAKKAQETADGASEGITNLTTAITKGEEIF